MPLLSIDAEKAFENLQQNSANSWPARSERGNRIEPLAKPVFTPSFQLEPNEMVFTIGSCFARNVEQELERLGFNVPMRHIKIDDDRGSTDNNQQIFNNYGVASIFNELQWALDPTTPFDPDTGLLELVPGKFIDLHLSSLPRAVSRDVAIERRRRIAKAVSSAGDCRVLIMTLGLAEVWWDSVAGRYLNVAPPKQFARRHPGRFSLHVLSYSEIVSYLQQTVQLLQRHGKPGHRIVLTVSPVPLGRTFTEQDVAVANTYSKSVLRASAEEITRAHDHIDYFPSYESVMLSDRSAAWMDDLVHVATRLIQLNVQRMVSAYLRSEIDFEALDREAAAAERRGLWPRAVELYRMILSGDAESSSAKIGLSRSLGAVGDCKGALEALSTLEADEKHRPAVLRAKIRIFRMNGLKSEFEELVPQAELIRNSGLLSELTECAFHFRMFDHVKRYSEELSKSRATAGIGVLWAGRMALGERRWTDAIRLLQAATEELKQSVSVFLFLGQAFTGAGDVGGARTAFEHALELAPDHPTARRELQNLANLERIG